MTAGAQTRTRTPAARLLAAAILLAAVAAGCGEDVSTLPLGPPRSRADDVDAPPRRGREAAAPAGDAAGADAATPATLLVDHAWVQDAPTASEQLARRATIERLRDAVLRGTGFIAAWEALRADPTPWHVAEGERYPYEVVPADARDLPPGSVSRVIPGDGGLHLFRILGRDAGE